MSLLDGLRALHTKITIARYQRSLINVQLDSERREADLEMVRKGVKRPPPAPPAPGI
jgi:hypothetical protein